MYAVKSFLHPSFVLQELEAGPPCGSMDCMAGSGAERFDGGLETGGRYSRQLMVMPKLLCSKLAGTVTAMLVVTGIWGVL